MKIFNEIEEILLSFRQVFSRNATFKWFCVVVFAFIVRTDTVGVSSIMRALSIEHFHYTNLDNFFHSYAFQISSLMYCWIKIVLQRAPIYKINGHCVILGDTISFYKSGKKIPGVVHLHNSSQQLNKPKYFWGQCIGFIAILTGNENQQFASPLMGEFHQGISDELRKEQGKELHIELEKDQKVTSIILMISMVVGYIKENKDKTILVLDAFYFAGSVFKNAWNYLDEYNNSLLTVVVRGKINAVGYLSEIDANLKNNKVRIRDYFTEKTDEFQKVRLKLYGEMKTIEYLSVDMYWNGLSRKIRFVLVIDGSNHYILACSNISFLPVDIIKIYSHRVKIETMFDKLKNVIGGFDFQFWSKYIEKLRKTGSKEERKAMLEERDTIEGVKELSAIASTVNAMESYFNMAGIALGILQMIALKFHETIRDIGPGFKRTESDSFSSVKDAQNIIKMLYTHKPEKFVPLILYRIIKSKQPVDLFSTLNLLQ